MSQGRRSVGSYGLIFTVPIINNIRQDIILLTGFECYCLIYIEMMVKFLYIVLQTLHLALPPFCELRNGKTSSGYYKADYQMFHHTLGAPNGLCVLHRRQKTGSFDASNHHFHFLYPHT